MLKLGFKGAFIFIVGHDIVGEKLGILKMAYVTEGFILDRLLEIFFK